MRNGNSTSLSFRLDLLLVFQENYYWLDRILRSYQSRVYSGDLAASFEVGGWTESEVNYIPLFHI